MITIFQKAKQNVFMPKTVKLKNKKIKALIQAIMKVMH